MTKRKIIDRISKLMALAGKNSNEEEAAAAMAKAQALMIEHELSEADVSDEQLEAHLGEMGHTDFVANGAPFARIIAQAIASAHMCGYLTMKMQRDQRKHFFYGRESRRIVASMMAEYVIKRVLSLGLAHKRNGRGDVKSFVWGAAVTIRERCELIAKQAREGELVAEDGTNLPAVVTFAAELDLAQQAMQRDATGTMKTRPTTVDPKSFNAGKDAGKSIGLNAQVRSDGRPAEVRRLT